MGRFKQIHSQVHPEPVLPEEDEEEEEDCQAGKPYVQTRLSRGISCWHVIDGFGKVFAGSKGSDSDYSRSSQVLGIDSFLSHEWSIGRYSKFLALCFHLNLHHAVVASMLVLIICFVLALMGQLPTFEFTVLGTGNSYPFSPWGMLLSYLTFLAVLFGKQEAYSRLGWQGEIMFLDKLCIHQSDAEKRKLGIMRIPTILADCEQMFAVYTPSYLARLWTLCEVCIFLATHPSSRLLLSPVLLAQISFGGSLLMLLGGCSYLGMCGLNLPAYLSIVIMAVNFLITIYLFWFIFCYYADQVDKLLQQALNISVESASCSVEADRKLVKDMLIKFAQERMYADRNLSPDVALRTFEVDVGLILNDCMQRKLGHAGLPFRYLCFIVSPFFSFFVDNTASVLGHHLAKNEGAISLSIVLQQLTIPFLRATSVLIASQSVMICSRRKIKALHTTTVRASKWKQRIVRTSFDAVPLLIAVSLLLVTTLVSELEVDWTTDEFLLVFAPWALLAVHSLALFILVGRPSQLISYMRCQRRCDSPLTSWSIMLVVDMCIGMTQAKFEIASGGRWSPELVASEIAGYVSTAGALYMSGISFGNADMGKGRCVRDGAVALLIICVKLFCCVLWPAVLGLGWSQGMTLWASFAVVLYQGIARGKVIYADALSTCIVILAYNGNLKGNSFKHGLDPLLLKTIALSLVCARTRYLADQRLAFCIMAQPIAAYGFIMFANIAETTRRHQLWTYVFGSIFTTLLVYANLLLRRRRRQFAKELHSLKFVRLGYLRNMVAQGLAMSCCQELPADAFGDPACAELVVAVSHCWYDKIRCDACSDAFPQGVKLPALTKRLEASLFQSWTLKSLWCTHILGGWDVLVFLDYMSVPQCLPAPDGTALPRNEEEQKIFQECLPVMGTLYANFPVLILLDDMTGQGQDMNKYSESGWCTCEYYVARLGSQLQDFSEDCLLDLTPSDASMPAREGSKSLEAVQDYVCSQLEHKRFQHEHDRHIAGQIIRHFVLRQLLRDAIRVGDRNEALRLLMRLGPSELQCMLNEPVDSGLNCLLHSAVQLGRKQITRDLLALGASPLKRNLRGDTADQCLLLPRLSEAASICRQRRQIVQNDSQDL
eukprot:TRINITY_DN31956_c0_g1_i1.p1 TRINITY_DN31956_c0_g1~~TRINITY_DN31956_c0_g1_i1.p1  ORF type:complete len:1112 (+),score=105.83 TRINITY_DN31956_c0_g1_i1:101-3436(+)